MSAVGLIDLLSKGSSIVLSAILVLIIFGWLVPGPIYKDSLVREKEGNSREKALAEKLDAMSKVLEQIGGLSEEIMEELKKRRSRG